MELMSNAAYSNTEVICVPLVVTGISVWDLVDLVL